MTETSDVIVVGGGTAGCVIAARLVESGHRVVALEAGIDYGERTQSAWPGDLLDATTIPTSHDWGYAGSGAGGQQLAFDRARVIGGCSSHNGCTQSSGWAGDWDLLADQVGGGWSADEMRPFFAEAARMLRLREYADDEVQPFQAAFLDACSSAGLPRANDFTDLDGGAGAGCAPVNVEDHTRINTAFAYLDVVRESPRLTVVSDAVVDRVILTGSRAVGVEYLVNGARHRVDSDLIVVSAGTYGTPEVLLRSGIGPAAELEALGIDVVHDLPGVGKNLHDQPTAELRFEGTAELAAALADFSATRWLPEEQAIAKVRSPLSDSPFDLHLYPWVEPDPSLESGWCVVIPVAQLRPRSRGGVRLRSSDPNTRAEIATQFFSDPEGADLASVVFGVRWFLDEVLAGSLTRFIGASIGADARALNDDELGDWVRAEHTHYWHPVGTSRMGRVDDELAVVDGHGCVIGLDGLIVADASVFPDAPRATTALPTVATAERLVAFLKHD